MVLGKYESLLARETKVIRGSVDILASRAHGNVLLLVACTMGPPKDEDFANLLNMRGILEREVFAETEVGIVPVVFTAATESPTYREVNNGLGFIPIINADGIDNHPCTAQRRARSPVVRVLEQPASLPVAQAVLALATLLFVGRLGFRELA